MITNVGTCPRKNCTPAQIALVWLLAQGEDNVSIQGTKHSKKLEENLKAIEIELSDKNLQLIEATAPRRAAAATRYPEEIMNTVNR
jgi:aryl-alcohol dehydrogenase-like predicted oxidoreductase